MIIRYIFPQFEQSILDDEKIHTFRRDPKKRWRAGMSIQHYMYSYMNPNSYKFLENQCFAVQSVEIVHVKGPHRWRMGGVEHKFFELAMLIDGRTLYLDDECLPIIQNDGLTKEEFITFCYCDPPYLNTANNYASGFTTQDSTDLFNCLHAQPYHWIMSEFDHPFILQQAQERGLYLHILGERRALNAIRTEILVSNRPFKSY